MRTFNKQIATAVVLDQDRTSDAVALKRIFMCSVAVNITGTPTGVLKLQASNDPDTNEVAPLGNPQSNPVNWVDIANSSFSVTAESNTMWNLQYIAFNYIRVVYTDSSSGLSTATMDIVVNGKGE